MSPVILILGSGSNVGSHVAKSFIAKGYKVAHVSRKPKEENNTADEINIVGDFSDPESIGTIFSKVKQSLGLPSVVVYNASAGAPNDKKDPLSLSLNEFTKALAINTTSAFAAAQQAVLAFSELPSSASKTFIYTGNCLNTTILAPLLAGGVGKSASAHMIHVASAAYADRGFKFYYADERNPDGSPAYGGIDGEAHGKYYLELSEGESQGPWQQTFVKGAGYKDFSA